MKKVLLVEDSRTQRKSFQLALQKAGYEVITAEDGMDGICQAYKFLPDLIVSDIVMPKINGYQLCRFLKDDSATKNIPIILLTVLNQKIDNFWGMRAGADAYLLKQNDFSELLERAGNFCEGEALFSQDERDFAFCKYGDDSKNDNYYTKITELLDKTLIESTIINDFRNLSEHILNNEILNSGTFSLLSSIIDYDVAGVFFNDRDDSKEKLVSFDIGDTKISKNTLEALKDEFFGSVFLQKVDARYSISQEADGESLEFHSKKIIPIKYLGNILGGICLYHRGKNKFNETALFKLTVKELTMLMRMKWLYSEMHYLSIMDGLTGLSNRRHFQHTIDREFSRAKRYGHQLTLAMFDIDDFKKLNDTYGHQFGDRVLAEVSRIIKFSVRKSDFAARYGGEEIAVILPDTAIQKAEIPLERIRKQIEDYVFDFKEDKVKTTVSIGLAEITKDMNSDIELIKHSDNALYEAKRLGKNRIEIFKGTFSEAKIVSDS